jgi:hypothetical protein
MDLSKFPAGQMSKSGTTGSLKFPGSHVRTSGNSTTSTCPVDPTPSVSSDLPPPAHERREQGREDARKRSADNGDVRMGRAILRHCGRLRLLLMSTDLYFPVPA